MITEIILIIFALLYYLFSTFLFITALFEPYEKHTFFDRLKVLIISLIVSPIAVPIILGIEIGEAIKDN